MNKRQVKKALKRMGYRLLPMSVEFCEESLRSFYRRWTKQYKESKRKY